MTLLSKMTNINVINGQVLYTLVDTFVSAYWALKMLPRSLTSSPPPQRFNSNLVLLHPSL